MLRATRCCRGGCLRIRRRPRPRFVRRDCPHRGGQTSSNRKSRLMRTDGTGWRLVYDGGPEPPNFAARRWAAMIPSCHRMDAGSRQPGQFTVANFRGIPGMNTAHDIFLIDTAGTNFGGSRGGLVANPSGGVEIRCSTRRCRSPIVHRAGLVGLRRARAASNRPRAAPCLGWRTDGQVIP